MRSAIPAFCALAGALLLSTGVAADAKRWWLGDWSDGYAQTRCSVRVDVARSQFRREIVCPGGIGARWGGEWTAEYRDGPCFVRQVATKESLLEVVECTAPR